LRLLKNRRYAQKIRQSDISLCPTNGAVLTPFAKSSSNCGPVVRGSLAANSTQSTARGFSDSLCKLGTGGSNEDEDPLWWTVSGVAVLVLAVAVGALAEPWTPRHFNGVINDYTPISGGTTAGEVRGPWNLNLHPESGRADFSVALTYGVVSPGAVHRECIDGVPDAAYPSHHHERCCRLL
jgi:hypothetical protein